jgi:hypothetical protein
MYVSPKPHCGMGNPNEPKIAPHGRDNHYYEGYLYQCEAPTLQMTMKWLREVHNIDCTPYLQLNARAYTYMVVQIKPINVLKVCNENYKSYEEAVEAAIKYCLENLI